MVNPDMIRLGREALGITQGELANELGMTQSKISKMEAGLLPVSDGDLESLSRILVRPASFFLWPDRIYGFESQEMFHRKRKSAPAKTLSTAHAEINIRRMQVARLLRSVNIHGGPFPQIDPDEYNGDIVAVVQAVRAGLGIPRGPVRNLVDLIEGAGAIVLPHNFGTPKIDAISHWVPGLPPLLFFQESVPGDRLRFSLAHECGHLIMHRIAGPESEREADVFASELLMPAEDIRHQLTGLTLEKLAALKPYWKVSMQALLMRAETLQTISPRQARRLWAYLSKMGYKRYEPVAIPVEAPSLYRELYSFHRTELGYRVADMGDLLGEERPEIYWSRDERRLSVVS